LLCEFYLFVIIAKTTFNEPLDAVVDSQIKLNKSSHVWLNNFESTFRQVCPRGMSAGVTFT
jgi:hypothetical protein